MPPTVRPRVSTCDSCGDQIIWCRTVNNKRMPVDVEPTPDGNLLLSAERVPLATPVSRNGNDGKRLHKAHFATCRRPPRQRRRTSPVPPVLPHTTRTAAPIPLFQDAP